MNNVVKVENVNNLMACRCSDRIRPELQWFVKQMEAKLKDNDHKPHWQELHPDYLIERLYQEAKELWEAVNRRDGNEMVKEAADVANFAMMIADVAERLDKDSELNRHRGQS